MIKLKVPEELAERVAPLLEMHGKAEHIALRYELKDPQYLANILQHIHLFTRLHADVDRADSATKAKILKIRSQLETINRAIARIFKLEPLSMLGGSLLAVGGDHNIFGVANFMALMLGIDDVTPGPQLEPSVAALQAFIIPLGEYWFYCTGGAPAGTFSGEDAASAPVAGTAAAFIVDCLRAAGWEYSNARISAEFNRIPWELHLLQFQDTSVH